jgi:murein L,D-transpeptidase YcbB/YkuD
MKSMYRVGIAACACGLLLVTGCKTPTEKRLEAKRDRRLHERLDDIQTQLLTLREKEQARAASVQPAPALRPVVPVREKSPTASEPTAKKRLTSLSKRYNLKPVRRSRSKGSASAKSKSKRKSSYASLRKKHVRVPVPVRIIQQKLVQAQCSPGPIDGRIGPKTIAAIKTFQRKQGLKVDGIVGPATWSKLRDIGG